MNQSQHNKTSECQAEIELYNSRFSTKVSNSRFSIKVYNSRFSTRIII